MHEQQHSFGGRALDRHVFDFDPDDGIGDGGAAAVGGEVEPAADPAPAAESGTQATLSEAEEAPSTTVEPAAVGSTPTREELDSLFQQNAQILAYLERTAAQPTAAVEEEPLDLDPLSESFGENLQRLMQQTVEQALAGVQPVVQSVQQERAAAQKEALIDSLNVEGFDKTRPEHRQYAEFFAVGMIDQVKAELGVPLDEPSPRAAAVAMQRGAQQLAAFAKAEREAGKQAYIAELEALKTAGQQRDLPVSGGGTEGAAEAADEAEAVRRLLARTAA